MASIGESARRKTEELLRIRATAKPEDLPEIVQEEFDGSGHRGILRLTGHGDRDITAVRLRPAQGGWILEGHGDDGTCRSWLALVECEDERSIELCLAATKGDLTASPDQFGEDPQHDPRIGNRILTASMLHIIAFCARSTGIRSLIAQPVNDRTKGIYMAVGFRDWNDRLRLDLVDYQSVYSMFRIVARAYRSWGITLAERPPAPMLRTPS